MGTEIFSEITGREKTPHASHQQSRKKALMDTVAVRIRKNDLTRHRNLSAMILQKMKSTQREFWGSL